MFSSTSYFWPLIVGLVLFGVVLLVAVAAFAFALRRTSSTPAASPAPAPAPVPEQHLAAKRLHTIVAEADLHPHDRAVLDGVAAKLEPTPITREGLQAMLAEQLAAQKPEASA